MMTRAIVTVVVCGTLLCGGAALATPSPQQTCDNARITAWKNYAACIDAVVSKDAKGITFDEFAAFAKCRHAYFKKWTGFQTKASFASSTCQTAGGARFTNNGTTVTDNLTTLVWEKKGNIDGVGMGCPGGSTCGAPHDADNLYTWSTASTNENGAAFRDFLTDATTGLNVTGFAGANGWRLPTLAELQSIVLDYACTGAGGGPTCNCGSDPCIDATFDSVNTQSNSYWSATSYLPSPDSAWSVFFLNGYVYHLTKTVNGYVRAVRGGL